MSYTTIRISKDTKEYLEVLRLKYCLKSSSDVVQYILDYLIKYDINLRTEFSNSTLNNILNNSINANDFLVGIKLIIESLADKEDKNTNRIIKILQAQERDILKPLLTNNIQNITESVIDKELNNVPILNVENNSNVANDKIINDKIFLYESEITDIKKELDFFKSKSKSNEEKYNNLISKFTQSTFSNKYSITLTEEEFKVL